MQYVALIDKRHDSDYGVSFPAPLCQLGCDGMSTATLPMPVAPTCVTRTRTHRMISAHAYVVLNFPSKAGGEKEELKRIIAGVFHS